MTDGPPPYPELDPRALHGLAGDIILQLEPNTEADPAAMLTMLLAGVGNAIGAGPHARVGGAIHPARINVVVVGETSRARKGQAWADTREPLRRADEAWTDKRVMSGLGSGEGLIAAVRDPEDDHDQSAPNDKRLFVLEPEFARVLAVCAREGATLSAIIREAWDDGRLRVMTRSHPMVATGAHVAIVGHITVEELRRRLTETESANGFANRFLFVCARRSKLLPSGPVLADEVHDRLGKALRDAVLAARKVERVRRTPGAEELWTQQYHRLANDDPGGLVGAITARAEAQLLRLSLLYALLAGAGQIDVAHLEAAEAVWNYCAGSAAYIFGDSLGDPIADQLLAAVRAAGAEGLDRTQQSAVFGRHVAGGRLDAARGALIERKLVFEKTIPTEGRSRVVLVARPYGTAKKAKEAKEGNDLRR